MYNPRNWYWAVANRPNVIFSSGEPGYLPSTDAVYMAWLANRNIASRVSTDGELADVLNKAGVDGSAILATDPNDWGALPSADILAVVRAAGISVSYSKDDTVNAIYESSGSGFADMQSVAQYISTFGAFPNSLSKLPWAARDKTVLFSSTDDFLAVVRGIGDYIVGWATWSSGSPPTFGSATI